MTRVTWDETAMRKALPPGVTPEADMNGGINICKVAAAFWGEVCPAEAMSVKLVAPAGDPFAQFHPKKVNWAIRFRGSVAVAPPNLRP